MKTYIIHVQSALDREKHMESQLKGRDLEYEFVLDGDLPDLNLKLLSRFFEGDLLENPSGATSCAYKHLRAYEKMIVEKIPIALILEDDIHLEEKFSVICKKILQEIKTRNLSRFLVSIEDSYVRYVKGSERKKGQFLYSKEKGRMAGAYIVDLEFAKSIIDFTLRQKCIYPIDHFHNYCCKKGLINIFWSHPTVAFQGSLSGEFSSLIDHKSVGFFRSISFNFQRYYKRFLYLLR